jgi:hypothetical protein
MLWLPWQKLLLTMARAVMQLLPTVTATTSATSWVADSITDADNLFRFMRREAWSCVDIAAEFII